MSTSIILHGVPVCASAARPPAEAIGLVDGSVALHGSMREVRQAMPPGAHVVDLAEGAVVPAFVDAHQHAYLVAADPATDTLYRVAQSVPQLVKAIGGLARARSEETGWLRFHGYQPMALREHRSPTARELDAAESTRPCTC